LTPAIERFLVKISVSSINFYNNTPCWEWQASKNHKGYGRVHINYKMLYVHRFMYEYYHGEIDPKLTIDHLCRNHTCCNPKHLKQETSKVNILKGIGLAAINARKTHCKRGHEFTKDNTYLGKNMRSCKKCTLKRASDYYQNNREKCNFINRQNWQKNKEKYKEKHNQRNKTYRLLHRDEMNKKAREVYRKRILLTKK